MLQLSLGPKLVATAMLESTTRPKATAHGMTQPTPYTTRQAPTKTITCSGCQGNNLLFRGRYAA